MMITAGHMVIATVTKFDVVVVVAVVVLLLWLLLLLLLLVVVVVNILVLECYRSYRSYSYID